MKRLSRFLVSVIMILVGFPMLGFSQDKKEPEKRDIVVPIDSTTQENQKLPSIELPEFLITGKETIDLPEFKKSAADNKVRAVDTDNRNSGNREAERVTLGASRKEQVNLSSPTGGQNGRVEAGYGSYATPYFLGWFGQANADGDFLLRAGYESSSGHIKDSDYRRGSGLIRGGLHLSDDFAIAPGGEARGSIEFVGDSYRPYGSDRSARQRTLNTFSTGVAFSSDPGETFRYNTGLYVKGSSLSDSLKTTQTQLGVEFNVQQYQRQVRLVGSAAIWLGSFSSPLPHENPYFARVRVGAQYTISSALDIAGGASLYGFRGSDTKNIGRVLPDITLRIHPASAISLVAAFQPRVDNTSLEALVSSNPYLRVDAQIRHAQVLQSYLLGGSVDISPNVRASVAFRAENIQHHPIRFDSAQQGLWTVEYFGTSTLRSIDGELSLRLSEVDYLGMSISVRDSKNSLTGKVLPYYPSVVLSAVYAYTFPFDLKCSLNGEFLSGQYADVDNQRLLKSIPLLGFNAEYSLIKGLSVLLSFKNITNSNQIRFEGYKGRPFTALLGAAYSW